MLLISQTYLQVTLGTFSMHPRPSLAECICKFSCVSLEGSMNYFYYCKYFSASLFQILNS